MLIHELLSACCDALRYRRRVLLAYRCLQYALTGILATSSSAQTTQVGYSHNVPATGLAAPEFSGSAAASVLPDPGTNTLADFTLSSIAPSAPITGFHLTLDDEFNILSVSDDPYIGHTIWTTGSWWYGPSGTTNLSVRNGMLHMLATTNGTGAWTGAHLSTWSPSTKGFSQRFGYWEIRCKFSGQAGILNDFYLISENDILTNGAFPSAELDIFEKPKGNLIYMTLRNGTASQGWRWNEVGVVPHFDEQFHTIGALRLKDDGMIQWFIDGQLVWVAQKYNDTDLSPMVMTLESGVNGAFGGPDSSTSNPSDFVVDWVRVWSNDPSDKFWSGQQ